MREMEDVALIGDGLGFDFQQLRVQGMSYMANVLAKASHCIKIMNKKSSCVNDK
jgi:hypothetical protein